MSTATYNARERRLVLENADSPSDPERLAEAISAFADPDHMLVVDLTHVPSVSDAILAAVDGAYREAEQRGCLVRVWHAAPVSA